MSRVPDPSGRFSQAAALHDRRAAWGQAALGALQPGAIVGERYRLEAPLGRGGMGIVYAAVHVHTRRAVALKLSDCPWNDDTLALYNRLLGEARAASAVRHRNVVDVLDMGYHAGAPYLVMERLMGESMERALERLRVLPVELALEWLLPLMGALAALHQSGIVHRDVKPSNIFLACDEAQRVVPKLLDFGLARAAWDAPLTEPGITLGTPEYMAPERARCREVGPQADVWSMGMVLFECVCGRLPLTATDLSGIAAQVLSGDLLRARDVNPALPGPIADAIDRALQVDPAARYADMASFAGALGEAALRAGFAVPDDPDPVGLPEFGALRARAGSWASGPLTRGVAAEVASGVAPAPLARRARQRWLALAVALPMFVAGVVSWRLAQHAAIPPAAQLPAAPAAARYEVEIIPRAVVEPLLAPVDAADVPRRLEAAAVPAPLEAAAGAPRPSPEVGRRRASKPHRSGSSRAGGEQSPAHPARTPRAAPGEIEKDWL